MLSIFYRLLSLQLRAALVITALLILPSLMFAQSALTDDAHTNGSPSHDDRNFGARTTLTVSLTGNVYIKFKLSSTLPSGTPGSDVARATVKLYIDSIASAGKIDIYQVSSAWDEGTITFNNPPTLGSLVSTSAQIEEDKEGKFVAFDVTPAVQQWLGDDGQGTNGAPNHGVALVPHPVDASTPALANITFDSKENVQTSHEPQLHIAMRKPAGLETVAHDATLSGDGTATNPVGVAAQGINTAQLADGAVTGQKIGPGQVLKSLNGLYDNVTLQAGSNITITPSGNTLTIEGTGNGLSAVSHNTSLTGDGTSGSPLGITVPMSLTGSAAGAILSVSNTSGSTAIAATGDINTSTQYKIGGERVFSIGGVNNTFVGVGTGHDNTTGGFNSFFGINAGYSTTTGYSNSFFGVGAGQFTNTGFQNSFFGVGAGFFNTTGVNNAFFGTNTGGSNTTGVNNSFFGTNSGIANLTGTGNSFFGTQAGLSNTDGRFNVFLGTSAGLLNTTGSDNVFLGVQAGRNNISSFGNIIIGSQSGHSNTNENFNTFIGYSANGAPGVTNATAIGARAQVTQSNSLVLGSNVPVGIGTTAPAAKLHVQGGNIMVGSAGNGIILKSPNGATCRLLTIDDAGFIALATVTCP